MGKFHHKQPNQLIYDLIDNNVVFLLSSFLLPSRVFLVYRFLFLYLILVFSLCIVSSSSYIYLFFSFSFFAPPSVPTRTTCIHLRIYLLQLIEEQFFRVKRGFVYSCVKAQQSCVDGSIYAVCVRPSWTR